MRAALLVIAVLLLGVGCAFASPVRLLPTSPSQGEEGTLPLAKRESEGVSELRVPVLMYHHVGDVPARDPYGLFVSTSTFRAQMQALKDKGLELHGDCPITTSCDGRFCIFISPLEDSLELQPTQTDKFYSKLHSWEQKRLARLREEIKKWE